MTKFIKGIIGTGLIGIVFGIFVGVMYGVRVGTVLTFAA